MTVETLQLHCVNLHHLQNKEMVVKKTIVKPTYAQWYETPDDAVCACSVKSMALESFVEFDIGEFCPAYSDVPNDLQIQCSGRQ